jgi:ribosomal-protein-alanine acetyltransferase
MRIRLGLGRRHEVSVIAAMSRDLIEHGIPCLWDEDRIFKCIFDPDCVVLVARNVRRVAGFAIAEFCDDKIHLNLCAVHPGYQRQGVGRMLLEWIESSAQTAGCFVMQLEVRASNPNALGFYKKYGFSESGIRHKYYAGREDAVCLTRKLKAIFPPAVIC